MIVDTTVWLDYLRGTDTPQAAWVDREIERRRLGLTDLILCEVLQGVSDERTALATQRELLKFQVFSTGGVELATSAALNYRRLRGREFTIRRTLVCLIATFCLDHQHVLLHNDRDFDPFERVLGLQVVHPVP
ncbi:MAG: PIN domain nuclease [Anaerolineales bacterium]|nr:PIN domain nuclease [Anaerolineales bacterium]